MLSFLSTKVDATRKSRYWSKDEVQNYSKNRLKREIEQITTDPSTKNFSAHLKDDNIYEWGATIEGPTNSPYEGGKFLLDISFPEDYAFRPPKVTFRTRIYHCNISSDGKLSLDILNKKWSPALTVGKLLLSILSLLNDCDCENPFVPEIAAQYINSRDEHDNICREWTRKYASEE